MRILLFYLSWVIITFFALFLASIALSYFSFDLTMGFLKAKQHMIDYPLWLVCFYVHLFFGAVAILTGLPLFFSKLIPFQSKLHTYLGRLYVYSILLFTGPTGVYLSFSAEGGKYASLGFLLMSFSWMFPTFMAVKLIIEKNTRKHYRWIIRSYCMTLSGVTLRLFMPFGARFLLLEEKTTFVLSSYVFIINIILGELILFLGKKREQQVLQKVVDNY